MNIELIQVDARIKVCYCILSTAFDCSLIISSAKPTAKTFLTIANKHIKLLL